MQNTPASEDLPILTINLQPVQKRSGSKREFPTTTTSLNYNSNN